MALNKAMLIGNLGRDPEIRYTKSGEAVANFTLATSDVWRDKAGAKQEKTEWHNIVAFGKLADLVQTYLKKGRRVYVEGRLQTRDWVDNQNVKHYRTEVVANNVQFLDRTQGEGGPRAEPGYGEGPPEAGVLNRTAAPRDAPARGAPERGAPDRSGDPGPEPRYVEDDIPF
ncbi:MAG: single-stranded DNA-binding protein [Candidatus Lambdaproteobacteria bacterium]|nr:single-stranded DNA-binding protein [Candidatus Lambdaproteobacteria bacterium]